MFVDLNVLWAVKRQLVDGPDAAHFRIAQAARRSSAAACTPAEIDAAVEARRAYMFTHLDRRQLHDPARFGATGPVSKRWHAKVARLQKLCAARTPAERQAVLRELGDKLLGGATARISCACEGPEPQQHEQQQQDAGAARKKQKQ
jgi:hypothetical protein